MFICSLSGVGGFVKRRWIVNFCSCDLPTSDHGSHAIHPFYLVRYVHESGSHWEFHSISTASISFKACHTSGLGVFACMCIMCTVYISIIISLKGIHIWCIYRCIYIYVNAHVVCTCRICPPDVSTHLGQNYRRLRCDGGQKTRDRRIAQMPTPGGVAR